MMKELLCVLVLMLAGAAAQAHPGVGIVKDSRGNLFYTDTKQVWKIMPDGKKSVAVPNVHTHELCLDAEDNLYGEHLWYEGEATKKWGHRIWCLKRDGTLVDVIPAREGFLRDYSFVRDRAGNMYWADRGAQTVIKKRSPDGKINVHATAESPATGANAHSDVREEARASRQRLKLFTRTGGESCLRVLRFVSLSLSWSAQFCSYP
jgi:hypothetical protein